MARVKKGLNAHKRHKKVLKMAKGYLTNCLISNMAKENTDAFSSSVLFSISIVCI